MIAPWSILGGNVLHIWNNIFVSKTELLYQVLVDGFLWQMDDHGKWAAILILEEIEFDEFTWLPVASGICLEHREGMC